MKTNKEFSPYLKGKYSRNRNWALVALLIGGLNLGLGFYFNQSILTALGVIVLMSDATLYFLGQAFSYRSGIHGEKAVARELQDLDDSFHLLNDVLIRGVKGNIDHILAGPKGIFIIETKNNSKEIRDYKAREISKELTEKARFLSQLIKVSANLTLFVEPICVFTHPKLVKLPDLGSHIKVLPLSKLTRHIIEAQSSKNLTELQLELISERIIEEDKLTQIEMARKKSQKTP